jgi:hypothetical protein
MPTSKLATKITEHLQGTCFRKNAEEMLSDLLEGQDLQDLLRYADDKSELVMELVDALGAEEDEEELYRTITDLWLELKFEWARYNQVMNYQCARQGAAKPQVMGRGGVCSSVISFIEQLLRPRDIASLTNFVASPLDLAGNNAA